MPYNINWIDLASRGVSHPAQDLCDARKWRKTDPETLQTPEAGSFCRIRILMTRWTAAVFDGYAGLSAIETPQKCLLVRFQSLGENGRRDRAWIFQRPPQGEKVSLSGADYRR